MTGYTRGGVVGIAADESLVASHCDSADVIFPFITATPHKNVCKKMTSSVGVFFSRRSAKDPFRRYALGVIMLLQRKSCIEEGVAK